MTLQTFYLNGTLVTMDDQSEEWMILMYGSVTYFEDTKKAELLAALEVEKQRRIDNVATQEEINSALTTAVTILCKENQQLRLVLQDSVNNQPYPITSEEIAALTEYKTKSVAIATIRTKYYTVKAEIQQLVTLVEMNAYNLADDAKWQ